MINNSETKASLNSIGILIKISLSSLYLAIFSWMAPYPSILPPNWTRCVACSAAFWMTDLMVPDRAAPMPNLRQGGFDRITKKGNVYRVWKKNSGKNLPYEIIRQRPVMDIRDRSRRQGNLGHQKSVADDASLPWRMFRNRGFKCLTPRLRLTRD